MFGRELFVQRGQVLAAHLPGFVDHFLREGWIERRGDLYCATEEGLPNLRFLAELTRPLLEAYFAVCAASSSIGEEPCSAKSLEKAAADQFEHASILGEVGLAESSNTVTFGNAVDLLAHRGVLAIAPEATGASSRRERRYVRGPAYAELQELHERLAAALSGR